MIHLLIPPTSHEGVLQRIDKNVPNKRLYLSGTGHPVPQHDSSLLQGAYSSWNWSRRLLCGLLPSRGHIFPF